MSDLGKALFATLDCISFSFWQIGLRPLSLFWESRCFLTTIRIFKISHGVRCKKKIHSRCSTTNLPRLKHIGGERLIFAISSVGVCWNMSMKRPSAASKLLRENSAAQVTSESLSWKMRTEAPSAWDVDPQDRRPCEFSPKGMKTFMSQSLWISAISSNSFNPCSVRLGSCGVNARTSLSISKLSQVSECKS